MKLFYLLIKRNILVELLLISTALVTVNCNTGDKKNTQAQQKPDTIKNDSSANSEKDFSKIGFDLMKKEKIGELYIGLSYDKVTNILGKPEEKSTPEMWEADGEYHQNLKYISLGVDLDVTGESEANKTVDMIFIAAPCSLKTSRGIGIGSHYNDVKAAYKNEIDSENADSETIVTGSVYGGIIFKFENNQVKSIYIGASAE